MRCKTHAGVKGPGLFGGGKGKTNAAVGEDMAQRLLTELRIHRHGRRTGPDDRQAGYNPFRPARGEQRHRFTASDARQNQSAGQMLYIIRQFGIGTGVDACFMQRENCGFACMGCQAIDKRGQGIMFVCFFDQIVPHV